MTQPTPDELAEFSHTYHNRNANGNTSSYTDQSATYNRVHDPTYTTTTTIHDAEAKSQSNLTSTTEAASRSYAAAPSTGNRQSTTQPVLHGHKDTLHLAYHQAQPRTARLAGRVIHPTTRATHDGSSSSTCPDVTTAYNYSY